MALYKEQRQALKAVFAAEFPTAQPSVPIGYRNGQKVDAAAKQAAKAWVVFHVLFGRARHHELGRTPAPFRTLGRIEVQVFTDFGDEERSDEIAASVAAIFNDRQIGAVQCKAPEVVPIGPAPDGAWWQENVSVPFQFDTA